MGNCISNVSRKDEEFEAEYAHPVLPTVKIQQETQIESKPLDHQENHDNHEKPNNIENRQLFIDSEFPPDDSSYQKDGESGVQWLRASEIAELQGKSPVFIDGDRPSRFDVNQGNLGDCWFLAALSDLPTNLKLFNIVVPYGQSFENANGKFHFRFWNYGAWEDIEIDDYLPVNAYGNLKFASSKNTCEFWPALVEKAYAKFYGNYGRALKGGFAQEALEDLTGGISEELKNLHDWNLDELFKTLLQAYENNCLLSASIDRTNKRYKKRLGLACGHAYSLNKVVQIETIDGEIVKLLRIRNPWGNCKEWNGDWSDNCPNWNRVSFEIREQIDFHKKSDGEFYISIADFVEIFHNLNICHLSIESLDNQAKNFKLVEQSGFWPQSLYEGLLQNDHQFLIDLKDTDDNGFCCILISVMQKGARRRKGQGRDHTNATIGFDIYQLENQNEELPLNSDFLFYNQPCESERKHGRRSATKRFHLKPGSYVIMPKKESSLDSKEYLIRVLYEGDGKFSKLK